MIRTRIGIALLALIAVVNTALAQGSGTKADPAGSGTRETTPLSVSTLDGKSVSFASLIEGKPALLIFWATWCPVCREQTPRFQQTFERFGPKGLKVLAVNIAVKDTPAAARQYAREKGLTLPMYFDGSGALTKTFKVAGTPTVILIDRTGKVVSKGNAIDDDAVMALLAGRPIPEKKPAAPAGSGSMGR